MGDRTLRAMPYAQAFVASRLSTLTGFNLYRKGEAL